MKVIIYSKNDKTPERLMTALNSVIAEEKAERFNSIYSFARRANEFIEKTVIFILMPATKDELFTMNSIYELSCNANPIILILPDREKETVNMGFKLNPRFVDYADSNFMGLKAVVNKMINNK